MLYPCKVAITGYDELCGKEAYSLMYQCAIASKRVLRPLSIILKGERVYELTFQEALKLSLHNALMDFGPRRERQRVLACTVKRGQLGRMLRLGTAVDPEEVFHLLQVLGQGKVTVRVS